LNKKLQTIGTVYMYLNCNLEKQRICIWLGRVVVVIIFDPKCVLGPNLAQQTHTHTIRISIMTGKNTKVAFDLSHRMENYRWNWRWTDSDAERKCNNNTMPFQLCSYFKTRHLLVKSVGMAKMSGSGISNMLIVLPLWHSIRN